MYFRFSYLLLQGIDHHRMTIAPQAKPPPIALVMRRSFTLILPLDLATERASGIDAAEVLP